MKEEKYLIYDSQDTLEYIVIKKITDKGVKTTIYRSESGIWSQHAKGEKLLSIINDGSKIVFNKKIKEIDFSQLLELRLLLNIEHQTDDNKMNREYHKMVKSDFLINI